MNINNQVEGFLLFWNTMYSPGQCQLIQLARVLTCAHAVTRDAVRIDNGHLATL